MSSEPKLFPPDDEAETSDCLSPELALLGQQLSADANRISQCYPPHTAQLPPARPTRASLLPWLRISAAVLLATGTIGVAWTVWNPVANPLSQGQSGRAQRGSSGDAQTGQSSVDSTKANAAGPRTMPAVFFHDLTGPEQEAVLDLFKDHEATDTPLSI